MAWHAAMQSEMDAVVKNRTWELADLPRGHRAITLKWVFKLKRDEAGAIVKHKVRLVARGSCDFSLRWPPRRAGASITWTSSRRFLTAT